MRGIRQDDNGDLMIRGGDLVIGDPTPDIVANTMFAQPGDFKEFPLVGAGLRMAIGGKPDVFFPGRLKGQLAAQGIKVKRIVARGEEITVET